MTTKFISPFLFFLLIMSFSCSLRENTNSTSEAVVYQLIKTDSIRINKLEPIQITDYDARNKHLLAYATATKKCLELNLDGSILNETDLTGEGPGHFGRGLTELGYFGEGKIIHGPAVYFTYDSGWTYEEKIAYGASGYSIPLRYIDGAPVVVKDTGEDLLLRIIDHNAGGILKLESGHFEKANMISLLRVGDTEGKPWLSYPENSIYRTSELFYNNHQPKLSFNKIKNQLVLALPLEQKLYIYDAGNGFTLLETVELDLRAFNNEPRGLAYEDQHKNGLKGFGPSNELNYVYDLANSSILDVYSEGEVTIVVHKTGFSKKVISNYQEANALAKSESRTFTSVFVKGQKVFETAKRFPRLVRLSERQFLVPNINEEIERDYNQYDIYELSEKVSAQ